MFLHPLFRTLATQPELLAEHAGAYFDLASAEAAQAAAQLRLRAALLVVAGVCAGLGLGLAGVALLLMAALPLAAMPAPWALLAVPALPLVLAVGLWWLQRRKRLDLSFALLREQVSLDRELLRQLAARRQASA